MRWPLVCLLLARPQALRTALQHPALWLLALSSGLTNVAFNWAVTVGDVVRVVLLFYLMPAWSVLLAWRVLGERPTRMALVRLLLAFAGVALVLVPADAAWTPAGIPPVGGRPAGAGGRLLLCADQRHTAAPAPCPARRACWPCLAAAPCWHGQRTAGLAGGFVPALPAPALGWVLLALAAGTGLFAGQLRAAIRRHAAGGGHHGAGDAVGGGVCQRVIGAADRHPAGRRAPCWAAALIVSGRPAGHAAGPSLTHARRKSGARYDGQRSRPLFIPPRLAHAPRHLCI
jgi:hypothetical protein